MGDLANGGRELILLLHSPWSSQGEVLHSRRQGRRASGPQVLELLPPRLEIPDFVVAALADEHHLPRDAREVAQLGRDEQSPGAVEFGVLRKADEESLPLPERAIEGG